MLEATTPAPNPAAERVRDRLRKDLRFLTFYMSPLMENFENDVQWLADLHRMPVLQAKADRDELLRAGFWVSTPDGGIRTNTAKTGLGPGGAEDLTMSQFLTLISQILSRLSETGPCWMACHTVVTSRELKNEFLSQVSLSLDQFLKKSVNAPGETVLSWTHVSLDTLASVGQEEDQ